jgi:hypothetical protein
MNAVLTDDIPRRAAFMGAVRPLLNDVMKAHPGISTEDALGIVLKNDRHTAMLIDRTAGDLIDFSKMNGVEREVLRRALPFYSWMKGMTLRAGRLVRDDPFKANVSYQAGKQYYNAADERLGGRVPENLKGSIVIGHNPDGSPKILPMNAMNIFQTPADVIGMVKSPTEKGGFKFGGTNPLSSINPVFKAPIETIFGRDLFMGGPIYSDPNAGLGGILNGGAADNPYTPNVDESRAAWKGIAGRYLSSLGPMALYQRYNRASDAPNSTQGDNRLLSRTPSQSLYAYLGNPSATLNLEKAQQIADGNRQFSLVGYDPSLGESPGVFGKKKKKSASSGSSGGFTL